MNAIDRAIKKQLEAEGRVQLGSEIAKNMGEDMTPEERRNTSAVMSIAGFALALSGNTEAGKLVGKTASHLRSKK